MWKSMPFVFLVVLAGVAAQSRAGDVTGRFIAKNGTEKPVTNVRLMLNPATEEATGGGTATTDASGGFQFKDIGPGTYNLALYPAWEAFEVGGAFAGYHFPPRMIIEVGPNGAANVMLVAVPGASVKGRIVDEAGKPLAKATITALPNTLITVHSDNEGKFILGSLAPDEDAEVRVSPSTAGILKYTRILRLKAPDLKPGATVDVGDLKWKRISGTSNVRGAIRTSNGEILVEPGTMRVFELKGLDEPISFLLLAQKGRFESEVLPGRYDLFSPSTVLLPSGSPLKTITVAPTGVTEFDITLDPKPAAK
jgi:hypothetical protein